VVGLASIRETQMAKAIAMLSGGLDSTLAAWLVIGQGVEVLGLTFESVFHPGPMFGDEPSVAEVAAKFLGVPLKALDDSERLLALVKSPKHGYGSHMNPCIDCRVHRLRQAKQVLDEIGGDFIVTGEVLGQRPMSQRRGAMSVIDREAGLEGRIVRPLSARCLDPTIPEQQGLLDREKLMDINGRSRRRQMELAESIGLAEYPTPAGGCLLTDPVFSIRLRELLDHCDATCDDVALLRAGRHFRLDDATKAVVGRHEADNALLGQLARAGDVILVLEDVPGPSTLLRGEASEEHIALAAALTARFSKARSEPSVAVGVLRLGGKVYPVNVDPKIAADLKMIGEE